MQHISEIVIVTEDVLESYKPLNTFGDGFIEANKQLSDNIDKLNLLTVLVNDVPLIIDQSFTIKENKIFFTKTLKKGDKLVVNDGILNNVKIISKNPYNTSIFKVYSSDVKLKLNHTYHSSLRINKDEYGSKFLTKFDPFLVTVAKIRLDTGELLEGVTDEQIARVIYSNSILAIERYNASSDEEPSYGEEKVKLPLAVKNYARYRTDLDLCYAVYLSISGKRSVLGKKIGSIAIDKKIEFPKLSELLSRFKELLKPLEDILDGKSKGTSVSFVKAGGTDYPLKERVGF